MTSASPAAGHVVASGVTALGDRAGLVAVSATLVWAILGVVGTGGEKLVAATAAGGDHTVSKAAATAITSVADKPIRSR